MSSVKQIWAIRMPGGPTKILQSGKTLTEAQAKKHYLNGTTYTSSLVDKDPDIKWPLCKVITEQQRDSQYSWCMQPHSMTGKSLYLIEVENGVPDVRGTGK